VQTYFIGYATYAINGRQNVKIGGYSGPSGLVDLKVSSAAVATRNPRLIMVVIDRSASMLATPGGGASGLPPAVVQFLDFFDTSSDNIGIVSFGSSARLEMPLTTNFIIAGTNDLIDAYNNVTNSDGSIKNAEPGVDPESRPVDANYDPNYNTTGIRRLKFGGDTAADDGIRLAIEQLMANSGFNDPNVIKYMVIFTDGRWNASRTLLAAPGYTNTVTVPTFTVNEAKTNVFYGNAMASNNAMANGQESVTNGSTITYGPWIASVTTNMGVNSNLMLVPTLSPLPYVTNAIAAAGTNDYASLAPNHTNDTWISADTTTNEPLGSGGTTIIGAPTNVVTTSLVGQSSNGGTNYYTHNLDVWLQPGSVDYLYHDGAISNNILGQPGVYVSDYTEPTKHINLYVNSGDSNVLVVPGYIADGVVYDGLDLNYPDNVAYGTTGYPRYRDDNYQQQYMWPDDTGGTDPVSGNYYTASLQRQLMFRNYVNLLTGFYAFRADEPNGTGTEPLITDAPSPGAPRPRYGLGAYYPSAGFYWPFGGELTNAADVNDASGYVTNAVGVDVDATYGLQMPTSGAVPAERHIAYSINMLSSNAAPEWYGELFYDSISGGGTNVTSGTGSTAASQIMQSSDWQNGISSIPYLSALANISGLMTNEPTHDTNIVGSPSVWRPLSFNGSNFLVSGGLDSVTRSGSSTGGYVTDGNGNYYANTMAWSGRPTHYFDFSQSKWIPIADNHDTNVQFLQMGNWKAEEYAWHARALGVTIYTVAYGSVVPPPECTLLAEIANATNVVAPVTEGSTDLTTNANAYNPGQPIGEQFYATNETDISNDFYSVGQAINAALTQ
jgi:hypothetical protein